MTTDWHEPRELIGPTLALRPLRPADAADYLAALGDPISADEVFAHLSMYPPRNRAAATATVTAALAEPDRLPYAQRLRDGGAFVGTTSFYEIDPAIGGHRPHLDRPARSHPRRGAAPPPHPPRRQLARHRAIFSARRRVGRGTARLEGRLASST